MLESINEIAVLVSSILAIAIGSIWYSPLLFGTHWMRAAGLKDDDLVISQSQLIKLIGSAIVANLVLFNVLARTIAEFELVGTVIWSTALLLTLFLAAFTVSSVIWEKRPLSYVLIHIGYAAVVIFGGMGVIAYWPW